MERTKQNIPIFFDLGFIYGGGEEGRLYEITRNLSVWCLGVELKDLIQCLVDGLSRPL